MFRIISLYQNAARLIAAAGTPGDLRDQLKCPLGRSQIRHAKPDVDPYNADERNIWKIVALGEHLGPDQQVDPASGEIKQCGLHFAFMGHRVTVYACDTQIGKLFLQLRFVFLLCYCPLKF